MFKLLSITLLLCNVKVESKTLSCDCINTLNNENQRSFFFEQIENHINLFASNISNLVIGADFNYCLIGMDRYQPPYHLADISMFESMMDKIHVYDVQSKAHNNNAGFTYAYKYYKTPSIRLFPVTKCFLKVICVHLKNKVAKL